MRQFADRPPPRAYYEKRYCAGGGMENQCQLDLSADRTSSYTMRANQLRLWLASFSSVLMSRSGASA
jgi:Transposase DDE domain group 1